jgi:hypothetical protein
MLPSNDVYVDAVECNVTCPFAAAAAAAVQIRLEAEEVRSEKMEAAATSCHQEKIHVERARAAHRHLQVVGRNKPRNTKMRG